MSVEYKTIKFWNKNPQEEIAREIKELAKEGWRVIHQSPLQLGKETTLVLEREIKDQK